MLRHDTVKSDWFPKMPHDKTELYVLLLISSHFEHYGSVSMARAQCKCIGHGPRSRFRSVRSEMKSTVKSPDRPIRQAGNETNYLSVITMGYTNTLDLVLPNQQHSGLALS